MSQFTLPNDVIAGTAHGEPFVRFDAYQQNAMTCRPKWRIVYPLRRLAGT